MWEIRWWLCVIDAETSFNISKTNYTTDLPIWTHLPLIYNLAKIQLRGSPSVVKHHMRFHGQCVMMTSSNGNTFRVTGPLCGLPVNSPHKGQWRGALMFSLICTWINGRVNNREADDLRRHRAHYDVTVMVICASVSSVHREYSLWNIHTVVIWFVWLWLYYQGLAYSYD